MAKVQSAKVRVVVIGAGGMANSVHYPSLASMPDVEMVAVCDLNVERMNKTADRYHIAHRFTNYQEMIKKMKPDAVYAIGQPHLLFDVWV